MITKILIIKLGALGDVVRTLSILPAIKEKYPNSEVTWVTKENALQLFELNPYVDNVFKIPFFSQEEYDVLYNLDIEKEASDIAEKTKAREKYGFYFNEGFPMAYNLESEYYLNTIFDDELKRTNKKTYQEMIFEALLLEWKNQKPVIFLSQEEKEYSKKFVIENNLNANKIVGIHMGASSRWPSKVWHKDNLKEFIIELKKLNYDIILFGGPNEIEDLKDFSNILARDKIKICINNPKNTIKQFASLVSLCKFMICSDSFALHIALSLGIKTIGLFFCTSPNEIEGYGLLEKVVAPRLYDFFPDKSDLYSEELVKSISPKEVISKIKNESS